MGIFAGASASGQWREYSLWRHSAPFGHTDPYFNRDAGFYVFELPWWHYLTDFVMAVAVIGLMAAALVHYLYGGIRLSVARDRLSGAAQVHLSALLGVFVLAKAADYWLDRFDLVTGSGSLFTGMGYTDDHAVLPAKEILTGHRADLCGAVLPQHLAAHLAAAVDGHRAARAVGGAARADRAGRGAAVPGQPQRPGQGGDVHRGEHRGDAGGVQPRRHRGRAVRQ